MKRSYRGQLERFLPENRETRDIRPALQALDLVDNQTGIRQAVDLGCGAGNETRQLVQAGWQVLAIDREPEAIARTTANCAGQHAGGFMPD
ncbi:SAM-dependent methyltransferase [Pseudomonas chlororaphis]|uniref:SAM-dependent methyltransferase n=1 Tax=Pseudomonas chlororaphis TaxID=587753 RepID=A0A3G7TTR4_9PSED|nr:methyltransferase domain-containing protein [Pseudomonas chlororaphis]AZE49679.1 SAM-dependent methyltransferase [Pseudomonas chlororaphis]